MESFYIKYTKRILDVVFSLILIIVLSPLFAVVAILVRSKMGSPVLFKQERPGKREKVFTLYKFRTMAEKHNAEGKPLPDVERLTDTGITLRKFSLDELPQLINIIKGDMSFIGPRPLLLRYYPYYTPEENRRHDILPGVTGLAQINGRNLLKWDERLRMDVEYVDNTSFMRDFRIFLMTVRKVIKREGVVVRDENPMLDLDKERIGNEYRAIPKS